MINSVQGPLLPSNGVAKLGVNLGKGSVMPLITLTKGQIMEGVVVQLQPRLLVETPASIFSAAASAQLMPLESDCCLKWWTQIHSHHV